MRRMLISSFYNTLIDKEDAIPMSTMIEIDKLSNIDVYSSIFTYNKKKYIEISSSNTINSIVFIDFSLDLM